MKRQVIVRLARMFKSLVVGVLAGWFARKVQSVTAGIVFGLAVGAFFAYLVARCVGGALLLGDRVAGERAGGHRRVCDQRYGPARAPVPAR